MVIDKYNATGYAIQSRIDIIRQSFFIGFIATGTITFLSSFEDDLRIPLVFGIIAILFLIGYIILMKD